MSALCQKRTLCAAANSRYSITSSARASTVPGMVRPNAFAVLRLTTRSNLVARSEYRLASGAAQNLVNQFSGAPEHIGVVRSVGDQAPGFGQYPQTPYQPRVLRQTI